MRIQFVKLQQWKCLLISDQAKWQKGLRKLTIIRERLGEKFVDLIYHRGELILVQEEIR